MARKRQRIPLHERQQDADASKAGRGLGKPKVPVTTSLLIELQKIGTLESENPDTKGDQLVIVEFKVLGSESDEVKEGEEYGCTLNLDREFNSGNCPDSDRLQQLVEVVHATIKAGGDDPPSIKEIYKIIDDGDEEAFAGLQIETRTARKKSKTNMDYTLHTWHVAEG
jgi:hypothetical protein